MAKNRSAGLLVPVVLGSRVGAFHLSYPRSQTERLTSVHEGQPRTRCHERDVHVGAATELPDNVG